MKFLIREKFFKDVPLEKIQQVESKLNFFYEEINKNLDNLKNIPKGFWIKKLRGIDNRYEFRVNNGDRIFFSLIKRDSEEESLVFILYSTHDMGVKKGKRAEITSLKEIEIEKVDFEESDFKNIPEEIYLHYNEVITYEVLEDKEFKILRDNKNKYFYYYLNDEQYEALIKPSPLFIAGSAGSGKSTLTIRKILNLEEHKENLGIKNIIYFTGNRLLKEDTEFKCDYFRSKYIDKITKFYTPREYYHEVLKVDTRKIVRLKKFREFLMFSFPNRKKLQIEDFNIYFEIMGILKGLMHEKRSDNWDRDLTKPLLSFKEYENLSKTYSLLTTDEKKEVYKIALKYEEWKRDNSYYDMNDLAIRAIEKSQKFDYLIIDEIQDFTETEIFFMFNLLKDPTNALIAGDIHQMINFNSFNFERLKNYYYKKGLRNEEVILSKNYRNSKSIVTLANYLTDLRKDYMGNLGIKDYKESFINDSGKIRVMSPDYEVLSKVQDDINFAIIVSSKDEKHKLEYDYNIKTRVFSVDEVKGLEYDNVICLNLATTNLFAWEKIFNREVKKDQRYRKYFNLFYVGITRCRQNLIIMEDNIKRNTLLKRIEEFISIGNSNEDEIIKNEITKNIKISSKEEWFEEAKRLYYSENYEEAAKAFEKSGHPTWILEREIEEDIENEDYNLALEKISKNNLNSKKVHYQNLIIDKLFKEGDELKAIKYMVEVFQIGYRYSEAKKIFLENLNTDKYSKKEEDRAIALFGKKQENNIIGDIYYKQENYILAINFYKKTSNYMGISKARRKIIENEYSKKIKNLDEKIKIIDEVIGKKDINTHDKNKMLPIFNALKYNDSDILEIMIFLGANLHGKVMGKYNLLDYIAYENKDEAIDLFECLLKKEYRETLKITNENPIIYSLKNKNYELTDYILRKKIIEDDYGSLKTTPLLICIENNQLKYFKIFLAKLIRVNLNIDVYQKLYVSIIMKREMNDILSRQKQVMKKIFIRYVNEIYPEFRKKIKELD